MDMEREYSGVGKKSIFKNLSLVVFTTYSAGLGRWEQGSTLTIICVWRQAIERTCAKATTECERERRECISVADVQALDRICLLLEVSEPSRTGRWWAVQYRHCWRGKTPSCFSYVHPPVSAHRYKCCLGPVSEHGTHKLLRGYRMVS